MKRIWIVCWNFIKFFSEVIRHYCRPYTLFWIFGIHLFLPAVCGSSLLDTSDVPGQCLSLQSEGTIWQNHPFQDEGHSGNGPRYTAGIPCQNSRKFREGFRFPLKLVSPNGSHPVMTKHLEFNSLYLWTPETIIYSLFLLFLAYYNHDWL